MTIKIYYNDCDTIEESCKQAVQLAIKNDGDMVFEFNGIELKATPKSDLDKLVDEYLVKCYALFENEIISDFYDKLDQSSLLLQYLYDSKNNKQKLN